MTETSDIEHCRKGHISLNMNMNKECFIDKYNRSEIDILTSKCHFLGWNDLAARKRDVCLNIG